MCSLSLSFSLPSLRDALSYTYFSRQQVPGPEQQGKEGSIVADGSEEHSPPRQGKGDGENSWVQGADQGAEREGCQCIIGFFPCVQTPALATYNLGWVFLTQTFIETSSQIQPNVCLINTLFLSPLKLTVTVGQYAVHAPIWMGLGGLSE